MISLLKAKDINYPWQTMDDLSLKDALYLITLIRSPMAIPTKASGSLARVPLIFPDMRPDNYGSCIHHLIDRNLITLSQYAFIDESSEAKGLYFNDIKWTVHIEDFEETLYEIIASAVWPVQWQYDIKRVWLEIAVLECGQYLEYLADERGLNIEINDEIQNLFLTLLRNNSVSQCFSLMHDAVCEASDNFFRKMISIDDIGNNFIQSLFNNANKTHWAKEDSRPVNMPQSQLSYVFHYEFLRIGEAGFTAIPQDIPCPKII
jgi:hypothetical protein